MINFDDKFISFGYNNDEIVLTYPLITMVISSTKLLMIKIIAGKKIFNVCYSDVNQLHQDYKKLKERT